ncbi:MAG: CcmD family protein [Bacteroidia bacterium]
MNKIALSCLFFTLSACIVFAQQADTSASLDGFMRSSDKLYVVVASLVIIFAGIIMYLISIERKLKKLEDQNRNK